MEIGIIGLPQSGKTTVFNALTKGKAQTSAYGSGADKLNIGVAKVPDPRLQQLDALFKPKKITPTEVRYVDIPGGPKKGEGVGGEYLSQLQKADALLHVVRDFEDPSIPHIEGSVNPQRDIEAMNMELAFSDLALLEKRLQRLEVSLKGAKPPERDAIHKEQALLSRIKAALEGDIPLREQEFSEEDTKAIANYQFLTAKPLLLVLNIGEEKIPQLASLEAELGTRYSRPQIRAVALCGKLEMELGELEEEEAREFRQSMGLKTSGLERMIRISYELLGLISFFTTVSGEVKAWTITRGTPAQRAAGKIHTDIERGFIRAEVIGYNDLMRCGSLAEARKQGVLRLEGKTYIVNDGDVITFLFNV